MPESVAGFAISFALISLFFAGASLSIRTPYQVRMTWRNALGGQRRRLGAVQVYESLTNGNKVGDGPSSLHRAAAGSIHLTCYRPLRLVQDATSSVERRPHHRWRSLGRWNQPNCQILTHTSAQGHQSNEQDK